MYKKKVWTKMVARLINKEVQLACKSNYRPNVVLTGGRSAASLYKTWSRLSSFKALSGINFYLSDERIVPNYHVDSNQRMIMDSLFINGIPNDCFFYGVEFPEGGDPMKSLSAYEEVMPNTIDVLILALGDDGHIASLFPGDQALLELKKKVVFVKRPPEQHSRITISPIVIKNSKFIFVLAPGNAKWETGKKVIDSSFDVFAMPAKLAVNGTWFFEKYD